MLTTAAVALWLIPGLASAGMMNHFWKHRWPLYYTRADWLLSLATGLLGPLDLVPTLKFLLARVDECPLGFDLSWVPQCGGEVRW